MAVSITIKGADVLKAKLAAAGVKAPVAIAAALVAEQEQIIALAKARTPVDTGVLRGSGTVLPPQISGTKVQVDSGFGGAASDYALIVHEDMSANHPVGQSKFLESAALERSKSMGASIGAALAVALARLGS